jgi:hypothetical protein
MYMVFHVRTVPALLQMDKEEHSALHELDQCGANPAKRDLHFPVFAFAYSNHLSASREDWPTIVLSIQSPLKTVTKFSMLLQPFSVFLVLVHNRKEPSRCE